MSERINFHLGNHRPDGIESLRDMTLLFSGGLEQLGYDVRLTRDHLDPAAINILFEYFPDDAMWRLVPRLEGLRYGIICTEQFDGGRFFTSTRTWREVENFGCVASGARFLWSLDEASVPHYAGCSGLDQVHYVRVGYSASHREALPVPDDRMAWDVAFMGRYTPYRQAVVERLESAGMSVYFERTMLPPFIRNAALARARLHLALRLSEDWLYPSPMRIAYLLANDYCVVSERCVEDDPIQDFTVLVDPDQLVERCRALIDRGDWRRLGAENGARFREAMPMAEVLRPFAAGSFTAGPGRKGPLTLSA